MAKKNQKIYVCDSCGEESLTWSGRCGVCGEWNTLKEISVSQSYSDKRVTTDLDIKKISEISNTEKFREKTGMSELDRVFGGGLVSGSVVLLGGEPGIGKSTITTQLCKAIDKTFYISAEESLYQIKDRVERLKVKNDSMLLMSGGDLLAAKAKIINYKPRLLVVDSIQTVYISDLNTSAGSISQVKESALFLQRLAKEQNISVLIIGHVTKDGNIAGPKIIEHLVDTVLYLEGNKDHSGRIIRSIKNRFGATSEIGIFEMTKNGLDEVLNPSELFLSQRVNKPGSIICPIMEGRRILFMEIQALTMPTKYGYPKRTTAGFDLNRLNILAAVIQKSAGINISNHDIYLNVVGGLKIKEPAADLAVSLAIVSSYKNKICPDDLSVFGEIGLMGEIRKVNGAEERKKKSKKMNYKVLCNEEIKNVSELNNSSLWS